MYGKLENGTLVYFRETSVVIDGKRIFNPTAEHLSAAGYYQIENVAEDGTDAIVDGVIKHYVGAPYVPTYGERVEELIAQRHSLAQEIALINNYLQNPDNAQYAAEYAEYAAFRQACKEEAQEGGTL